MSHTYASFDDFNIKLSDGGSALGTATAIQEDVRKLLEAASRAVDDYLDRSNFGTGFGPRVVSAQRYEGDGCDYLDLRDDWQALALTVYDPTTASSPTYTLATDTDYTLLPVSGPPYNAARLHGFGTLGVFPYRSRILAAGTAGFGNTTRASGVTVGTAAGTALALVFSSPSVIAAGHTVRVASEDIYIQSVSGGTAVVLRGQNGTTAAAIADASAVAIYTYDSRAVAATLGVAQRRRKNQDAGLTGDFGVMTTTTVRDTERSILQTHVGKLKDYGA